MRDVLIIVLVLFVVLLFLIQISGSKAKKIDAYTIFAFLKPKSDFSKNIMSIKINYKYLLLIFALLLSVILSGFVLMNRQHDFTEFFPAVLHSTDLVSGDLYMFFNSDQTYDLSLNGKTIVKSGSYEIKDKDLYIDGVKEKAKLINDTTIEINDVLYSKNNTMNITIPADDPYELLKRYMDALVVRDYKNAYQFLSRANSKKTNIDDFIKCMDPGIVSYVLEPSYSKAYNSNINNNYFQCAYLYNIRIRSVEYGKPYEYSDKCFVVSENGNSWNVFLYDLDVRADIMAIDNNLKNGDLENALPDAYAGPNVIDWPVLVEKSPPNTTVNQGDYDSYGEGQNKNGDAKASDKKLEEYLEAIIY